jgi:hypothetical protein
MGFSMVRLQSLMSWVYKKIIYLVTKHLIAFHVDCYIVVENLPLEKAPHIPAFPTTDFSLLCEITMLFPRKSLVLSNT